MPVLPFFQMSHSVQYFNNISKKGVKKMKKIVFVFSAALVFLNFGCDKQQIVDNSGLGSLYDPAIKPSVIFTYPANNSVGPFTGLYPGSDYYYNPHFRIQFNKIMDYSSVIKNEIKISGFSEPVVATPLYAGDNTGIYQFGVRKKNSPEYYGSDIPYQLGKKYTVTVPADLEDIHNQKLGKDYSFSFSTEPNLMIISSSPKDSISYYSSQIRLTFNSQVDTNIFSKISFSPSLSGNWYVDYNGLSIYYYLNNSFTPNTLYTVTVAGGAKDKFGNSLAVPYTYSFKSGEFKIVNSYPSDRATGVSLTNSLSFYFSAAIQSSSVQQAFSISPSIGGSFYTSSNYINFQPVEPLKEKTIYTATFNTTLAASNGNKLASPYSISFTTEGFRVYQFYPNSYDASRYTNVEVQFNSKVDTSTAKTAFVFSPTVSGKIYFSNKNMKMIFRPDTILSANTQYNVTFSNALRSAQGNPLDYTYNYSFKTGD